MKNFIFIYDISIYTVQIISLIFTFFIYTKQKSRLLKYYLIVMFLLFIDNSIEISRIYIESIWTLSLFFKILKNSLLFAEFYFGFSLIYLFTNAKMTVGNKTTSLLFSLIPLFLSVLELIFSGNQNFIKYFFWLNLFLQSIIVIFLTFIIISNYNKITDKFCIKIRRIAFIFTGAIALLYLLDSILYLSGFYPSYIFVLIWNILNIYYLWKYNFSQDSNDKKFEIFIKEYNITPKEKQIILLIKNGLLNKEIADELNVTEGTIKIHIYNIFQKVGVNTRIDLINHLSY